MTRYCRLVSALALLVALLTGTPVSAAPEPAIERYSQVKPPPRLGAHGAVLLDWQTGELLWGHNAHRKLHPASTTKVLTALIAIERGQLDAKVRISRRAALTPGSTMYLKQGEVYSLHDLLHGLLMRSGNDAAVAIAEHIAGSVEEFAKLMNQRARELGAVDSHFVNPHGLTHNSHLSTAYDLAIISRAALSNPIFASVVAQPSKELTYEELGRQTVLHNTNRLLWSLPGADGVKTGTTGAAGPCLIASATRDEQKLIAVVLNASNRWQESVALLEWGFSNWQLARLGRAGEILRWARVRDGKRSHVPVALGADLAAVLPRQAADLPALTVTVEDRLEAPLAKGTRVGTAVFVQAGQRMEAPLVAAEKIAEATWLDRFQQFLVSLVWATDYLGINLLATLLGSAQR